MFLVKYCDSPRGQDDKGCNMSGVVIRFHMKIALTMGFIPISPMAKVHILLCINKHIQEWNATIIL
jgi:hypothetical protein